jgi:hypothetical protein
MRMMMMKMKIKGIFLFNLLELNGLKVYANFEIKVLFKKRQ